MATLVRGKAVICKVHDRHQVSVVDDGAVVIENGRVTAVGRYAELRAARDYERELGSAHHLIVPGFINSHHHVGLTPLQLGSPDLPLELWFASRLPARRPDPYLDTLYSAFEMLESGITTVQHLHGWVPGGPTAVVEAAGQVLKAYDDIGMRVSYSFALRDQNRLVYEPDEAFIARLPLELRGPMRAHFDRVGLDLEEQLELFKALYAEYGRNPRQRVQLAPANLHWCSDEALSALSELSQQYDVPMHMHVLETAYQKEYALRRTGTTAVEHLHKLGMLGEHMTLGHGVWLTESDIELVAGTHSRVCHNCSSNFRLRSGVAPLNEYERLGVKTAIGLDEAGINDDRDMLQEMRMVLRAHRVPGMDDTVPTCAQVLRMATEHGAETTPYAKEIGVLEAGRAADLVLIDWNELAFPYLDKTVSDVDALVQRAKSSAVSMVMVAGEVVVESGQFTRVDRQAVMTELASSLARNDTPEEADRRAFAKALFPHVRQFYAGYLDAETRTPYYRPSSSS